MEEISGYFPSLLFNKALVIFIIKFCIKESEGVLLRDESNSCVFAIAEYLGFENWLPSFTSDFELPSVWVLLTK